MNCNMAPFISLKNAVAGCDEARRRSKDPRDGFISHLDKLTVWVKFNVPLKPISHPSY